MTRGADLRYDLTLTFEEAAFGVETTLRVPRLETCPECSGLGQRRGRRAHDLHRLRRPRPGALHPGLLHRRPHLPAVPAARAG